MVIAYCLYAQDNNGRFFKNAPSSIFCSSCGSCIDKTYRPDNFISVENLDVSFSLDSRFIVSERFKQFCEVFLEIRDVSFFLINKAKQLFFMYPDNIIAFDTKRRETRFENFCEECGNFQSIIGATPAFLKNNKSVLRKGIFRTDIEFGSDFEKFPLIIVGVETKEQIELGGFSGNIYFKPVEK